MRTRFPQSSVVGRSDPFDHRGSVTPVALKMPDYGGRPLFRSRFDRILARIVGGGLFVLGIGELIGRLDEPLPLFYWLPTLWGGAVLVLMGSFHVRREKLTKVLVILGAVLGFSPSAWTVVMPVLMIALVIRTIMSPLPPASSPL